MVKSSMIVGFLLISTSCLAQTYDPDRPSYYFFLGAPAATFSSANRTYTLGTDFKKGTINLSTAGHEIWNIQWPQDAAPDRAIITNDGKRVILIDSLPGGGDLLPQPDGNGIKLVFIDEKGKVLKAYKVSDIRLAPEFDSEGFDPYALHPSINAPEDTIRLNETSQTISFLVNAALQPANQRSSSSVRRYAAVSFNLTDGSQRTIPPDQAKEIINSHALIVRRDLLSKDQNKRLLACMDAAALMDKGSVDILKNLLDDRTSTGTGVMESGAPRVTIHGIQTEAGVALAVIIGKDAVRLILPRLDKAQGSYDQERWLEALQVCLVLPDDAFINRMESSKVVLDRRTILRIVNEIDSNRGVKEARKLVKDRNREVKQDAMFILTDNPDKDDLPLLELYLNDPVLGGAAMSGIIRLNPPNLEKILKQTANGSNDDAAMDATVELARRGDKSALANLVKWIDYFASHPADVRNGPGSMMVTEEVAHILGSKNPPGTKRALEKALAIPDQWWDSDLHIRGALVQIGEQKYLSFLRSVAKGEEPYGSTALSLRRGDVYRRGAAVGWLGDVGDEESIPFLQGLASGTDSFLREQATQSLKKLNAPATEESMKSTANAGDVAVHSNSRRLSAVAAAGTVLVIVALIGFIVFRRRSTL